MYSPVPVSENSTAKLLWDFSLVTETHHLSNRPNVDYAKSAIQCFEVCSLAGINVAVKKTESFRSICP